jgi:alpha-methylacyl-CoA racemase
MTEVRTAGPLAGLAVIEMAGLGPAPLAALMLSELGADVVRIGRAGTKPPFLDLPADCDFTRHGRVNIALDLKDFDDRERLLRMADRADVLIEGFRPGVMERLGLGPDVLSIRNPRLVYGRMTGFGQDGPLAGTAGHDLTYLAWAGLLHAIGHSDGRPVPPLNLVADYGGGTMFLIAGILAALFERQRSGKGQVVDTAMIDGAGMLALPTYAYLHAGFWEDRRGGNLLDSGAPFYDTYETADGKHVAVACLEPQFFAAFAELLPLESSLAARQYDRGQWPSMRQAIGARFLERSRDDWIAVFAGSDACVAPVLSLSEAAGSELSRARNGHVDRKGFRRPAPAPRFSRTATSVAKALGREEAARVLERLGVATEDIKRLVDTGVA